MSEPTLQDCINYMRSQIKQMEKHPRNYEFNLPYYRKTVELLEKTDRPHGEWIPRSERLPEHGGFFLITNIDELVRVDFFRKSTNDFDNYSAIAWMPLPEPYKEEGDEE